MTDLPTGYLESWRLHVKHAFSSDGGTYAPGTAWKIVWHTTESSMSAVDAMVSTLKTKRAEPHFVIGKEAGRKAYTVVQTLPLNQSARALEHPAGTPETNRARCIQIEICGRASESAGWSDDTYRALASLACLIEHRYQIPRKRLAPFTNNAQRLPANTFPLLSGHCGHQHVPNQPAGHWDPGALNTAKLFKFMSEQDH